ncbi:L-lactate permease [Paenibacillus beijingensis]|uniref:L-lactate permease n=1 Tax=Paenibacillus beijingensis TaxID=1126833 RepID=A0A0D5NIS2_9BACL|nr:L-lactate permease [Paenibacillus beijingensis]AJY74823.1 L-lactate permease [Paenibacillus beijingensis]
MWLQQYDPFHNDIVSALVAALPILFFLLALTVFKMKGVYAALSALLISFLVAVIGFGMPLSKAVMAAVLGIGTGLWPIGYIVIMAVWLYKIAVKTGKFNVIRASIAGISPDSRLQLLLIGFCFNAFLEGAAGFGVPIAISAALLIELGFRPLKAAALCLIANAASGAFGAIGIPVIVGAQMGSITPLELTRTLVWTLPAFGFLIPFLLVFILDGLRGIRETLPALLVVGGVYTALQTFAMLVLGPELADIMAALGAMGSLALFLRKWQPKRIFVERGNGEAADNPADAAVAAVAAAAEEPRYGFKAIVSAWSPFYILTAVITVWSLPAFKALFAKGGALQATTQLLQIPLLHKQVVKMPPIAAAETPLDAMLKLDFISATGTAILVAVLITGMFSRNINLRQGFGTLGETMRELWLPIVTICFVMGFANVANFAGLSSTIGLALARTGDIFPLFSPVLGWIGVFITGSVVNNNALFGYLQTVTGAQIGTSASLLLSANTTGGVMAKLISPQSIAIAAAAVKKTGQESALFSMTIRYSLIFLLLVCVWTFVLSRIGI